MNIHEGKRLKVKVILTQLLIILLVNNIELISMFKLFMLK